MPYFLILRCHCYAPWTGPWELATDEYGELVTFPSREEADEWIKDWGLASLSRNEYARDYKLIEGTVDPEATHVERRLAKARPR